MPRYLLALISVLALGGCQAPPTGLINALPGMASSNRYSAPDAATFAAADCNRDGQIDFRETAAFRAIDAPGVPSRPFTAAEYNQTATMTSSFKGLNRDVLSSMLMTPHGWVFVGPSCR